MDLIILFFTCIINLLLGIFVLSRDLRAGFARSFVMMSIFICIWIISSYITGLNTVTLSSNIAANNISYISGYVIVLSGLIFTYFFPLRRKVRPLEIVSVIVVSTFIILFSTSSLVAGNVTTVHNQLSFSFGQYLWLYIAGFIGLLFLIFRNLTYQTSTWDKNQKIQARLVLIGFGTSAFFGLLFNAILPPILNNYSSAQFGPIATVILVAMIVYAIARHGLFNVRLAVVRTSAYVFSLVSLAAIYYLLAYAISRFIFGKQTTLVSQSPVNIGLALLLSFLFQPIKRFFDHLTNKVFYRDNYNTEDFFSRLTRKVSTMTDLMTLLTYASSEISKTLKASFGAFLVYRLDGEPVYIAEDRRRSLPPHDMSALDEYIRTRNSDIILTALLDNPEEVDLKRMLLSHRIALVLPIAQPNAITGYLFLGEHLSSQYTSRDVRALQTIADELTIAIQNALSLQTVKDVNATLQQRVDSATKELRTTNAQLHKLDEAKDEFISMASHQLRTPLTSVKGYISMVLEGDAGKVTPTQKQLLNEAFGSSERMVHLINDFLNVSRLQTGKFIIDKRKINLAQIVKEELDGLAMNAAPRGIKFTYKIPKKFPDLSMDEGKIRQVIMNFCDNAIYYSKEGSAIKVELSLTDRDLVFTVKDTGIGVPLDEQAHLFGKFFRAKNARKQRPDGTGVGLFLAKKVVIAHGGDVIFESKENKGSTFGFHLPLTKLRPSDNVN